MSIGKIRYPDGRLYTCDDCKKVAQHFSNEQSALAAGWAVAHGRKNVWCPNCAALHRHVGRNGAPHTAQSLPDGYEQTAIDFK